MRYNIEFTPAARKDLAGLPATTRSSIGGRIDALADNPRPPGLLPLKGHAKGNYRMRVGEHRAAYEVDDEQRVVTVWAIGHRSNFYKMARRRRK